ncbi:MAG: hypothetical protein COA82_11805 [Alkaliphilus sp.]|nr:ABC transporter ATP-binding protein [bacterium AH-315-L21]PHS30129.1 MAG: hypothetical protein COA82_11805 [Alkaliphilus sp.]
MQLSIVLKEYKKTSPCPFVLLVFSDYYTGEIYYNDKNIKELDMYDIRKKIIGVSQQEPKLINGSLFNNVTYGVSNYKYEEIEEVLNKLTLDGKTFSKGLETSIEEDSKNISGGEKLKISLPRVILKKPDVVILDEPTSALDSSSILQLKSLIMQMKNDKITIIVTHDYEFLDIADEVIDLNHQLKKNK